MDRTRLESFSDGVFAVAITLLALDLAVKGPGLHEPPLQSQLGHLWPQLVAYLISFFTIGVIWVNHHAVLNNIVVVDRTLLFLNLLLLAVIVALPFATDLMAEYLTARSPDANVAAAVYAGMFELMGLSFSAVFEWTLRHDHCLRQPVAAGAKGAVRARFYGGQIPYLAATGIALISATAAIIIVAVVGIYYIFERTSPAATAETEPPG